MYPAAVKQIPEGSSCQHLTEALVRVRAQVSSRRTVGSGTMLDQTRLVLYRGE